MDRLRPSPAHPGACAPTVRARGYAILHAALGHDSLCSVCVGPHALNGSFDAVAAAGRTYGRPHHELAEMVLYDRRFGRRRLVRWASGLPRAATRSWSGFVLVRVLVGLARCVRCRGRDRAGGRGSRDHARVADRERGAERSCGRVAGGCSGDGRRPGAALVEDRAGHGSAWRRAAGYLPASRRRACRLLDRHRRPRE